jgi:hypothetical protein
MPQAVQDVMTQVSFFEILVNIFIHRRLSTMAYAIFSPFLEAHSPEEAKNILKEEGIVPPSVYKALFRKVS